MDTIVKIIQEHGIGTTIFLIIIMLVIYTSKKAIDAFYNKELEIFKAKNLETAEKRKREDEDQKQQLLDSHQILQSTSQDVLKKELKLYETLIQLSLKNKGLWEEKSRISQVTGKEFDDNVYLYINELKEIEKTIAINKLFISNELSKAYGKLIEKLHKYDSELLELEIKIKKSSKFDLYYQRKGYAQKQTIYSKIHKESKSEFSNYKQILSDDILKIKDKLNLD